MIPVLSENGFYALLYLSNLSAAGFHLYPLSFRLYVITPFASVLPPKEVCTASDREYTLPIYIYTVYSIMLSMITHGDYMYMTCVMVTICIVSCD